MVKNETWERYVRHRRTRTKTGHFGLPRWLSGIKNLPASAEDMGSIPNPGRSHMQWNNCVSLAPVPYERSHCNEKPKCHN